MKLFNLKGKNLYEYLNSNIGLIDSPCFVLDVFEMALITNEWQVLYLVWILFQWKFDELTYLHVLLLLI